MKMIATYSFKNIEREYEDFIEFTTKELSFEQLQDQANHMRNLVTKIMKKEATGVITLNYVTIDASELRTFKISVEM